LKIVIQEVLRRVQAPEINWDDGNWKETVKSPPLLERQSDGWSCGIFVLMALEILASGGDVSNAIDRNKDKARIHVLNSLRTLE